MAFTEFLINIASGGVIGGFASFIASKYFLKHNNSVHRPIVDISDKLIKSSRDDGTPALRIKIINRTDKDISDIKIEVDGIKNLSPAGSIPLFKLKRIGSREVLFIKQFDKNDNNAHFAHQTNLFDEKCDIVEECDKYETIKVSLKATCPYYGTSFVTSKEYNTKEDILNNNHSFNTGDSLSCSSH